MIGVAVPPADRETAAEFFELCKTAWEPFEPSRSYAVIVASAATVPAARERDDGGRPTPAALLRATAPLLLVFGAGPGADTGGRLRHAGREFPIYGPLATFAPEPAGLVVDAATGRSVVSAEAEAGSTVVRVGYDLFGEVRHLLTRGQPPANAAVPTLELHAAILRDLVTRAGQPFVEIPPAPDGHPFIACASHDIDHPVLRNHRLDHTMFGFLQRAVVASFTSALRGRKPWRHVARNWGAALRLPFVQLGLARDFWADFDRYVAIEAGMGATYFFIPEGGNPGKKADGTSAPKRASRYELKDVQRQIARILAAGNEVSLHGLDAWRDVDAARRERAKVATVTKTEEMGIRMHWLYFGDESPAVLDAAGFTYDSTVGYNQTVGYRAGTTQAYRPPGTSRLLELPLHAMDTALFYPGYLELTDDDAYKLVSALLDNAAALGGAFVTNWHDRSIAPERLWDGFYLRLLAEIRRRGAWCPTMADAVRWFRKRRSAALSVTRGGGDTLVVRAQLPEGDALPALRIRVHRPCRREPGSPLAAGAPAKFLDVKFDKTTEQSLKI